MARKPPKPKRPIAVVSRLVAGQLRWRGMPCVVFRNRLDGADLTNTIPITSGAVGLTGRLLSAAVGVQNTGIPIARGTMAVTGQAPFTGTRGPQLFIAPPGGAVVFAAGSTAASRQAIINANPSTTQYAFAAGAHTALAANVPKSGDTYTGEYGAIIDGTGWGTTDGTQAAFRVHAENVDNVTIRNLVIRNMPQRCIHAAASPVVQSGWVVDHCNLGPAVAGVVLGDNSTLSNNIIHDNIGVNGGAFLIFRAINILIDNNEFYNNDSETKVSDCRNVTVQRNYFHDHVYNGLWFDDDGGGSIIQDNLIEDCPIQGMFIEICQNVIVRRNIVRRCGWTGISLHTSREIQVYHNLIEDTDIIDLNLRIECGRPDAGDPLPYDLTNNEIHHNTIRRTGGAPSIGVTGLFVDETLDPGGGAVYLSNAKNNLWWDNTYDVPTPASGSYWFWAHHTDGTRLNFTQWKALGQDLTGSAI